MSAIWSETRRGRATHALTEIEVDEVSLVDRPATGKRFVLFKRILPPRRTREEDANICSEQRGGGTHADEPLRIVEALQKRSDETLGELTRLQAVADNLAQRIAAIEKGRPARQSAETAASPARLWSGVL
jgi:hypothetical protein